MSYDKGRRLEWLVKAMLEEKGWVVVRAAGSKPVDLVAMRGGETILIECKYGSSLLGERRALLLELARKAGAKPVLARKKRYQRSVELVDLRTGAEIQV